MGHSDVVRGSIVMRRYSSLRLLTHNYRQAGFYFVTICTFQRQCLFDSDYSVSLVDEEWHHLTARFPTIELDAFVVMPNHLHGIIQITDKSDAIMQQKPALGQIIGALKSRIAVAYLNWRIQQNPEPVPPIWQRGYYDRVIRNERELNAIRLYIEQNSHRWEEDRDNLDVLTNRMRRVGS